MTSKSLYTIDIEPNGSIYLTPANDGGSGRLIPGEVGAVSHSPRKRLKKAIAAKRSSAIEDQQIEAFGRVFEEMGQVASRINASLEQSHRILTEMISDVKAAKSTSA